MSKSSAQVYTAPKLIVYGDVRTITQNVGNKGADDGVPGNKTST